MTYPVIGGEYRHYKGNRYTVIGIACHSETLEEMVVYRAEYGDHGLWVRPLSMFMELVCVDGVEQRRFRCIGGVLTRAAEPCEAESVYALYRSLTGRDAVAWDEHYPTLEMVRQDAENGALYVLYSGETLAAAAALCPNRDLDALPFWDPGIRRPLALERVAVDRACRRRGLASRLLTHAFEKVHALCGCDGVRLLVSAGNMPARALYASLGFYTVGETRLYDLDWLCCEKHLGQAEV